MTDAPKLLPCRHVDERHTRYATRNVVHYGSGGYAAECKGCEARGPLCDTKADAIAAWNRRPDLTDEQVERAAKAMFDVPTPDGDHFGTIIYESDRIDPCDNVQEGIATTMRYLRIAARAALLAAREAGGE